MSIIVSRECVVYFYCIVYLVYCTLFCIDCIVTNCIVLIHIVLCPNVDDPSVGCKVHYVSQGENILSKRELCVYPM